MPWSLGPAALGLLGTSLGFGILRFRLGGIKGLGQRVEGRTLCLGTLEKDPDLENHPYLVLVVFADTHLAPRRRPRLFVWC